MKEELVQLRASPWFKNFFNNVLKQEMPEPRTYDPSDHGCVEQWKADCMRREGYVLCLQKFGFKLPQIHGDHDE